MVFAEWLIQREIDNQPCEICGGDRLRPAFDGRTECHAPWPTLRAAQDQRRQTVADDPQLDDVREWYNIGRRVHDPFNSDANLIERFDRWLAEHDREVAMKAWGEAAQALSWCMDNGPADVAAAYVAKNNPYSAPVDAAVPS